VFERYNIVDQADLREAALKQQQGADRRAAELAGVGVQEPQPAPEGSQIAAMAGS